MQMNALIPMSGQQVDVAGSIGRGAAARGQMDQLQQQNALRQLYQQQGPGIAQGDPQAMNALARFDPAAAVGIQSEQQRMGILSAQERRAVETQAAQMSAQQRAQEAAQIEQGLMGAIRYAQSGDWNSVNGILESVGEPPVQSEKEFRAVAAKYGEVLDVLKTLDGMDAPISGPGKVQADIDAGRLPAGTQLRSPQVVVNTGDQGGTLPIVDKPSKDFQRRWDADRQTYVDEPIPGSDSATGRTSEGQASQMAMQDYERKFGIVDSKIDEAVSMLNDNGRWVAGYGSYLSGLPETSARDFQAVIDTIKANLGFEELQAMRDSSPTGGALGQVTEREIAFLQAIQGNLDTAQSPRQLRAILEDIKDRRTEFREERRRIMGGQSEASGQPGTAPSAAANLESQIRNVPDFGSMTDEQLDAWLAENGQ